MIDVEQSAAHADTAAERVVADARRRQREGQELHPRWEAQVDALDGGSRRGRPLTHPLVPPRPPPLAP